MRYCTYPARPACCPPHLSIFSARLTQHTDQTGRRRALPDRHTTEVYAHPAEVNGHILPHMRAAATVRFIIHSLISPLPNPAILRFAHAYPYPTSLWPCLGVQIAPPCPKPYLDRLNPKYRPIYVLDSSWSFFADHGRGRPARLHASSPLQMPILQYSQPQLLFRLTALSAAWPRHCLETEMAGSADAEATENQSWTFHGTCSCEKQGTSSMAGMS